jgi:hypothetical protein
VLVTKDLRLVGKAHIGDDEKTGSIQIDTEENGTPS